jgi:hypothetical protein
MSPLLKALAYRNNSTCPTAAHARPSSANTIQKGFTIEPEWMNIRLWGIGIRERQRHNDLNRCVAQLCVF